MPEPGPTKITHIAGRSLCILSYALSITVGSGDLWWPTDFVDRVLRVPVSIVTIALGILGILAVTFHRWRLEWVPAAMLTVLLFARAAPAWADVDDTHTLLAPAAMMTLGAFALGKRTLDLWVFSEKTRLAARTHKERRHDSR